jgi:hypothetical protein
LPRALVLSPTWRCRACRRGGAALHLLAHLRTADLLTDEQVARDNRLRRIQPSGMGAG